MSQSGFDPEVHCYDCGSRGKWEHRGLFGGLEYCKRCLVKGGNPVGVAIDYDKLVGLVGPEMAEEVLRAGSRTTVLT